MTVAMLRPAHEFVSAKGTRRQSAQKIWTVMATAFIERARFKFRLDALEQLFVDDWLVGLFFDDPLIFGISERSLLSATVSFIRTFVVNARAQVRSVSQQVMDHCLRPMAATR